MTHRRWVRRSLVRRCDVRTKYASHRGPILMGAHLMSGAAGYPSYGWVVWAFLSNLGDNGFFSILLKPGDPRTPEGP